jgi:DNA-binding MarR family transcriptional regulator
VLEFHAKAGPSLVDVFPLRSPQRRLLRWVVNPGPKGRTHRELLAFALEKGITERTFERWLQSLALRGYIKRPPDRRRGSYTALEKGQDAYQRLRVAEARKAKQ